MKTCHLLIGLVALAMAACTQTKEEPLDSALTTGAAQAGRTSTAPAQPRPTPRPAQNQAAQTETGQRPFVPKAPGHRVSRVSVPGPYVALTFDDGPSASLTPQVLDILNRYGARATFFVLGENAVRNKSILSRAVAEGHEIGSHTYSHIKMTANSEERIRQEMERTSAVIEEATGRRPMVMRPPYGATNARLVDMMYQNYGMSSVLWDIDTRDWQHPGVSVVVQRAVGGAKPGSIILLHDIHASTLAAVEGVVSGLQARGFKLVTVSQLISLGKRAAQMSGQQAGQPLPAAAAAAPVAAPASILAPPAPRPLNALDGDGAASIGSAPAPQQPEVRPAAAESASSPVSSSGLSGASSSPSGELP